MQLMRPRQLLGTNFLRFLCSRQLLAMNFRQLMCPRQLSGTNFRQLMCPRRLTGRNFMRLMPLRRLTRGNFRRFLRSVSCGEGISGGFCVPVSCWEQISAGSILSLLAGNKFPFVPKPCRTKYLRVFEENSVFARFLRVFVHARFKCESGSALVSPCVYIRDDFCQCLRCFH